MTASSQHRHQQRSGDESTEAQGTSAAPAVAEGYTRLHITPFDNDLLPIILSSAVLPKAQDISFHSLQTFPDKRYGFVNLPVADADKIKKKLNGAILRGTKVRIEPARPDDMAPPSQHAPGREGSEDDSLAKKEKSKKAKREKKRKRDHGEISGVELEDGRKVKRGWTVSAAESQTKNRRDREKSKDKDKDKDTDKKKKKELKRKEIKSKYSDGPECLVKTLLPANKAALAGPDDDAESKRKRKKSKSREVLVHEFEKTTKFPTFLKQSEASTSAAASTEYVDGKGWVDADGNVVEPIKSTRPVISRGTRPSEKKQSQPQSQDDDETSSSGSSSSDDEEEESSGPEDIDVDVQEEDTSLPSQVGGDLTIDTDIASPQSVLKSDPTRPKSSGSARSLTIKIPPPPATPAAQKVHPLEALYKRPKPDGDASAAAPSSDAKPFSFFDAEDIDEEASVPTRASQMPMTPFTQQDFEWRNIRSAAPTPDTAHPNKTFKLWPTEDDLEEEEEEDEQEGGDAETTQRASDPMKEDADDLGEEDGEKAATDPSTDFQKWFWEHRGDLNRSWKKRRKMAAKEKRYRENRARADRAI